MSLTATILDITTDLDGNARVTVTYDDGVSFIDDVVTASVLTPPETLEKTIIEQGQQWLDLLSRRTALAVATQDGTVKLFQSQIGKKITVDIIKAVTADTVPNDPVI